MNRKTKFLLVGVVIALIAFFIILEKDENNNQNSKDIAEESLEKVGVNIDKNQVQAEDIDRGAPGFTLENLEGEQVSLSDYQGKIVFLNFWATWCGFCDEEMPYFQNMMDNNDDLVVLAVNVQESKGVVESYIKEGGYSFPVLLDLEGKVGGEYLVGALPTTYLIDKEGNLLDRIAGMMTEDQMEEVLNIIREL